MVLGKGKIYQNPEDFIVVGAVNLFFISSPSTVVGLGRDWAS